SLELQSLLPYPNSCEGASPHQQGRDMKMLSFCGIDVSKDRLDVMVLPDEYFSSVPNDRPAGRYWSSSCAASRSQRSASRLAAATSVVPCARCKQPACPCAKSILSSCGITSSAIASRLRAACAGSDLSGVGGIGTHGKLSDWRAYWPNSIGKHRPRYGLLR